MVPPRTATSQGATDTTKPCPTHSPWTLASRCTLFLLAASAATLRFLFLTRKPFWFDECFSVEVARLTWHDFFRLLWWREANMALYYLLLREWLHFGSSPFFVRTLSVVASLATLPALFWLASRLFDRRVGIIAVALMSCNAYSVRYAQEARGYSLFLFLATLAGVFLVGYLREPSHWNRRGYVLGSVLAVYAHFYALLLLAAHWLATLGQLKKGESAKTGEIRPDMRRAWIMIGLAVLPVLAFVIKTGAGPIRWIPRPGAHDLLEFWEHLAGNAGLPLLFLYVAAALGAILPARTQLFRRHADWEVWRLQFLLIWLLFPVALTVALSALHPVFLGRYFIFCLPALIILAAAGLASLRKSWMIAVCLAVTLLLSLQGTFSYYDHDFDLVRDASEATANYIYGRAQPGDAILFHIAEARIPYEFFVSLREARPGNGRGAGPEIVFPRHADRLDYRDVTGNPAPEFLRSLTDTYPRVWLVLMSNGMPGRPDAATQMMEEILGESYQRSERAQFPQVEVRLYSRP
jgi:mannosyltransferase